MLLRQHILELIGRWDGSDAAERDAKRNELVAELLGLLRKERPAASPAAGEAGSANRARKPAA